MRLGSRSYGPSTATSGCLFVSCLFVSALQLVLPTESTAQSGGLAFLKLEPSAEALGAGSAFTAASADAFSTFINPAGLAGSGESSVALTYNAWTADVQLFNFAGRFRTGSSGGIGVALTSSTSGDFEARSQPGPSTSSFNATFLTAGAGYGHQIGPVRVGVTAKYVLEQIAEYSASGIALDAGAQIDVIKDRVWLGGAIQNVGDMEVLNVQQTELPSTYRVGATIQPITVQMAEDGSEPVRVFTSFDVLYRTDEEKTLLQFGVWVNALDFLWIRGGYVGKNELRDFTLGLGLAYESFRFDYAYLPFTEGFESSGQVVTLQYFY